MNVSASSAALARCPWPKQDPLYIAYHDEEWGVPEYDDRALYEKLVLDGFQAGLSWITILRKRENFRRAYQSGAKMAFGSARAWLDVMDKGPGFSKLLWDFVDGRPKINHYRSTKHVPAETAISRAMSKELSQRGFKFCGPTIVYAFMQATGMVNDHLVDCYRYEQLTKRKR